MFTTRQDLELHLKAFPSNPSLHFEYFINIHGLWKKYREAISEWKKLHEGKFPSYAEYLTYMKERRVLLSKNLKEA